MAGDLPVRRPLDHCVCRAVLNLVLHIHPSVPLFKEDRTLRIRVRGKRHRMLRSRRLACRIRRKERPRPHHVDARPRHSGLHPLHSAGRKLHNHRKISPIERRNEKEPGAREAPACEIPASPCIASRPLRIRIRHAPYDRRRRRKLVDRRFRLCAFRIGDHMRRLLVSIHEKKDDAGRYGRQFEPLFFL